MGNMFYIQDSRQYVGNNILFWAKGGNGYTCHVDEAQKYTEEEANRIHENRSSDVPLKVEDVERASTLQVDIQLFRKSKD